MSLRTGTELITLTVLINKISGVYGLLALLTGLELSPLQLSMYIYSCLALILTAFLAPHIRKQSPLQCLALAWFYIIDSVINATYTAAFSVTWFLVLSQHHSAMLGNTGPGGQTMDDLAGFTSPEFNVSRVDVVATPGAELTGGQDAVAVGQPGNLTTSLGAPSLGHGMLQVEGLPSLMIILGLWAIRIYFILIVMAYARGVLRMHMYTASATRLYTDSGTDAGATANPFAADAEEGQGWKGKLGRVMVKIGQSYWLGTEEDNSWARGMGGKFRKSNDAEPTGPVERERRRRSGTGPPPPPQPLRVQELR